jgi:transcriptional regulator with XRE-family HTH domain
VNVPPEEPGPEEKPRRRPYDEVSLAVGAALKRARLEAGLSQTELGKQLRTRNGKPLSRNKISSYERGQWIPEDRLRPQLARILKVPEEKLFGALSAQGGQSTLVGRLVRVERELEVLRQRFNEHLDAQAAGLAAREANRADRESRKAQGRSHGRRASKGDRD